METDLNSLLKAKDASRRLNCSPAHVYKLAERGQLPCIRWECPGNGSEKPRTMLRFEADAIQDFIENHRQRKE